MWTEMIHCPLCGRVMIPGPTIDEHHLVPKSKGGKDKYKCHRVCHRKIHATLTEKELAQKYHTWDSLKQHPNIQTFIKWVAKKPPEFYDGSISSKAKKRR